ncbi:MAG: ATP-binding protein [Traorella sp.]
MKKIQKVPINTDKILNSLSITSSQFEFFIVKKYHGFEYYIDVDDIFLKLLESKGYELIESSEIFDCCFDCGGKMGYDIYQKDILFQSSKLHIQVEELIQLLKGYPDETTIKIKISNHNMTKHFKRKLQLLIQKNKINNSQTLMNYMEGIQYYKIEILTNQLQLKNQLTQHFNLVDNQLHMIDDCTHFYRENEFEVDLFPTFFHEENTPFVNLHHLFEENISLDIIQQKDKLILGKNKDGEEIGLSLNDLLLDVGIFGASGCGKGNLLFLMLSQLYGQIPFFVIAPKGELPNLKSKYEDIEIYDPMVYCPLNIFKIPTNKTLREYLPLLKEIMVILLQLDEAPSAQALVQEAIRKTYYKFGYELSSTWEMGNPFSMRDFALILKEAIQNSHYAKNEKGNILQILMNRISNCMELEQVFDDIHCLDFHECLNKNIIIDLKQTPPMMSKLMMKIMTILLMDEIKTRPSISNKLQNILLIDEAHNLFGQKDDYFDQQFSNDLYELRSLGCGFVCCDQRMSLLESSILDNLTHIINGKMILSDASIFFKNKAHDFLKAQIMSTLPTGTYALQVKGTTLKNKLPMLHPILFTSENVIDDYLEIPSYKYSTKNNGVKLYSRCINCKSNKQCHNQSYLRDIAHRIRYHSDFDKLSKEDKIKTIVQELKSLNFEKIDMVDTINCVNFLLAYKPN